MDRRIIEEFERNLKNGIREALRSRATDKNSDFTTTKNIEQMLLFYGLQRGTVKPNDLYKELRNVLKPENARIYLQYAINKYYSYLNGRNIFVDKVDEFYSNNFKEMSRLPESERGDRFDLIANRIVHDQRAMQRISAIIIQESKRIVRAQALRQVAKRTQPVNSFSVAKTVEQARKVYKEIKPYYGPDYATNWFNYDSLEKQSIGSYNPVQDDILRQGAENKPKNALYTFDDSKIKMSGVLNIGTSNGEYKQRQEDSILILSHPKNPDFKIALVADGVGGGGDGDKASYKAVLKTMEWFQSLPVEFYTTNDVKNKKGNNNFYNSLINKVTQISDEINSELGGRPGCTYSAAIIRKIDGRQTVSAISLGDSKILKIDEQGRTTQLVKDDNFLFDGIQAKSLYIDDNDKNTIYTTDRRFAFDHGNRVVVYRPITKGGENIHILTDKDMIYYRGNNIINDCLGCGVSGYDLEVKIRSNMSDYITEQPFEKGKKLFLYSDGIGDNFRNRELGEIFVGKKELRQIQMQIINEIYKKQEEKINNGINNPNEYTIGHSEFSPFLKGSNDNMSGVIISNDDEPEIGGK